MPGEGTGSGRGSDKGMAAGRRRETLAEHLLDRAAAYGGDVDDGCVFPWQRLLAVCFIALAVGTWVTEIQVTNIVLGGDDAYDNAYALVWLAHVASGLFALVFAAGMGCCLPAPGDGDLTLKELLLRPSRDTLVNSLFMAILANLCSWTWFMSIPLTEAMVNTVIYQSCCVWCFVISVVLLDERVTLIKVVSTLATFAGVGVISNYPCHVIGAPGSTPSPSDPAANGRMLWGDFLCLCSALLYALYEVLLKMLGAGGHAHAESCELPPSPQHPQSDSLLVNDGISSAFGIVPPLSDAMASVDGETADGPAASRHDDAAAAGSGGVPLRSAVESAVFVVWMGVWNTLVLWLPLGVMHWTRVQPFHLPSSLQMPGVVIDCALEGAYIVWICLAIALSSPLFVTIGTVLAIPASAGMDALIHGIECPDTSLAGTGLVVAGFVGINVAMLVEGRRGWPRWL